jgi:hypothetical protein
LAPEIAGELTTDQSPALADSINTVVPELPTATHHDDWPEGQEMPNSWASPPDGDATLLTVH